MDKTLEEIQEVYHLQPGGIYLVRFSEDFEPSFANELIDHLGHAYNIHLVAVYANKDAIEFLPPKKGKARLSV